MFAPDNINHPLWVERIREMQPDIIFSFYYRSMVGAEILAIPQKGCLNLHGSLLPKYRGRCPANWVLVNGETETGVTLHYMTPQPDNGDIVAQEAFAISSRDTAISLHGKLNSSAAKLLKQPNALPALLNSRLHVPPRISYRPPILVDVNALMVKLTGRKVQSRCTIWRGR